MSTEDLQTPADETIPVETTGQDAGAQSPDNAASSPANGESGERNLLSVVRDAVDKTQAPDQQAASPAEGSEEGREPDANEPKPRDDENYTDVPFHKHPRFQEVIRERNAFKADAGEYRKVKTFLDDNGVSAEEAADLLTVGALAKTNPAKAWELAKPWVVKVMQAAGEILSPEMQAKVEAGELSREAAFEVSRARASVQSSEASQSFRAQQEQRRQVEKAAEDIRGAAVDWERERQARDPNFAAKVEPILREVAYRRMKGEVPDSPAAVKAQLDDIYKVVNAAYAPPAAAPAPAPRPAATRPARTPITGGSVAGSTRPKPDSVLDIVRQAQGG
ncbi:hypothetical protein [Methylorubrum zatmanii]